MNEIDRFLSTSKSTIRQYRRDRLATPILSRPTILVLFVVIVVTLVVLTIINKAKIVPQPVLAAAAACENVTVRYDQSGNDWYISPVKVGSCYLIAEDLKTVWKGLFSNQAILDRFADKIGQTGTRMPADTLRQAVLASFETGTLNLIE